MTIKGDRVNVTNVATPLNLVESTDVYRPGSQMILRNRSAVTLDVGGADVVSGAGFEWLPDEDLTVGLDPAEVVYAVGPSAGPHVVHRFRTGIA